MDEIKRVVDIAVQAMNRVAHNAPRICDKTHLAEEIGRLKGYVEAISGNGLQLPAQPKPEVVVVEDPAPSPTRGPRGDKGVARGRRRVRAKIEHDGLKKHGYKPHPDDKIYLFRFESKVRLQLEKEGIKTARDLSKKSAKWFSNLAWVGSGTLEATKEKLALRGLKFKGSR